MKLLLILLTLIVTSSAPAAEPLNKMSCENAFADGFELFAQNFDSYSQESMRRDLTDLNRKISKQRLRKMSSAVVAKQLIIQKNAEVSVASHTYRIVEYLGSGAEGQVYKVSRSDGKLFSLKKYADPEAAQDSLQFFSEARSIHKQLLISNVDSDLDNGIVVSQYVDGLTVADIRKNKGLLTFSEVSVIEDGYKRFKSKFRYDPNIEPGNVVIDIKNLSLIAIDPS